MKYFTNVISYSNCEKSEMDNCRKSSSTSGRSLADERGEMLSHCCRDSRTKALDNKGHLAEGLACRWQLPSRNCVPHSHLSKLFSAPRTTPTSHQLLLGSCVCSCPPPPPRLQSQAASVSVLSLLHPPATSLSFGWQVLALLHHPYLSSTSTVPVVYHRA